MSKVIAACLMLAAQTYSVPPAVLVGIYEVEGGKPGQAVGPNTNGTYDLGPMQINTLWIPELAEKWNVSESQAHAYVKNDPCTNMSVAAWILRSHINETRSLSQAIAHYHSRTPRIGYAYKGRVISAMRRNGLIKNAQTR
ncbi:MAG: lytic transglycosylase domain-containing protein [Pseudomonadota bacterium]